MSDFYTHSCVLRGVAKFTTIHVAVMQGCRQGWSGGAEAPKFKLMLLCVQAVTQKNIQNVLLEIKKGKQQLSGCKQCYTYIKQSLEVSKCMNLTLVACNKLDPRG